MTVWKAMSRRARLTGAGYRNRVLSRLWSCPVHANSRHL
ncbi:hypothetical protein Y88_0898 [Novosphingobium nitrogenifigens DSM 19370]|uniref:Uncharacterized protein n=1 Tax=Novosphingobium nitrogenifigens DSM 19370 TaxID=983920 RepID=F1Z903_9SPHN|nr:hypothetical protein Y88_0898 [Novosphingobium nitrogenifigens DSM 19370]